MFIRDSRRSYRAYSYAGLILITDLFSVGTPVGVTKLILITDLCLFRTPVGVTELILIQNLYLYGLMFIQDSRRSYRTYTYSELILITDLCLFRTPVGVTELILIWKYL